MRLSKSNRDNPGGKFAAADCHPSNQWGVPDYNYRELKAGSPTYLYADADYGGEEGGIFSGFVAVLFIRTGKAEETAPKEGEKAATAAYGVFGGQLGVAGAQTKARHTRIPFGHGAARSRGLGARR